MRLKLDENLPLQLRDMLRQLGHDVDTPHDEHLSGHPDSDIWEAAQMDSRFLITQDLDFSDSRKFAPGSHQGILLVRLRSPSRGALVERVATLFKTEDTRNWSGCFLVASERKLRLIRK